MTFVVGISSYKQVNTKCGGGGGRARIATLQAEKTPPRDEFPPHSSQLSSTFDCTLTLIASQCLSLIPGVQSALISGMLILKFSNLAFVVDATLKGPRNAG